MPKLILTSDPPDSSRPPVLLSETVHAVHLQSEHSASQLIERLRWALADAERLERSRRASDTAALARTPRDVRVSA
ncbi:MAG TPA: hypothetical protein VNZ05_02445 [Solirubrobacteraceae bacterium]|nr:hypothetical protein [Solirubrobacteraceae bacterium]